MVLSQKRKDSEDSQGRGKIATTQYSELKEKVVLS